MNTKQPEITKDRFISLAINWLLRADTEDDERLEARLNIIRTTLLDKKARLTDKQAEKRAWLVELLTIWDTYLVTSSKHKDLRRNMRKRKAKSPSISLADPNVWKTTAEKAMAVTDDDVTTSEDSEEEFLNMLTIEPEKIRAPRGLSEVEGKHNFLLIAVYHITFTSQLLLAINAWLKGEYANDEPKSSPMYSKNSLTPFFFHENGTPRQTATVKPLRVMYGENFMSKKKIHKFINDHIGFYLSPAQLKDIDSMQHATKSPIAEAEITQSQNLRLNLLSTADTVLKTLAQGDWPILATKDSYFLVPDELCFGNRPEPNGVVQPYQISLHRHIDDEIMPLLRGGSREAEMLNYFKALRYYSFLIGKETRKGEEVVKN